MARRKKRKNNRLLTRIFIVTVVLHAIALPIAAHYGAFKNIRRGMGDARIVMLSTNIKDEPEKPKEKAKEKPKQVKDTKKASSGAKSSSKANSNLPQPKVVTSGPAAGTGGGNGGPSAESGTGVAGKVPDGAKTPPPKTEPEVKKEPTPEPPKTEPIKKSEPPKADPPKTEPAKTPEPKAKKILEAVVAEAPEPEIPDDLRSEPLDKTLIVEAQIDTGGHPTDVTIVSSTGIKDLDRIGVETAKKYRFKPATIDGVATEQHVRFKIFFKVE